MDIASECKGAPGGGATTKPQRIHSRLRLITRRLSGVVIEQLDWRRCIELYDSPHTLFFIDPPYTTGSVKAYAEFTAKDMKAIRAVLRKIKGEFILTVDATKENAALFQEWPRIEASTAATFENQHGKTPGRRFGELIIYSPRS